ncbi:hypothetical protein LN996_21730 [Arthrobacter sp. AK01]|uniref:hypothetical protein n=1 Tax=Arthrobacter sp. AK01 TaxID=2894084 RepID=UPI001E3B47EB|nr:hypothetical protein [Arthrobacter sp. AK01]MCD4853450.1 hypothetical protein [Arthrobacter sp. AK01]
MESFTWAKSLHGCPGKTKIVAKSFSTLPILWAEETRTPGIWLTPLLTDERLRSTICASSKDDLFIGGSLDELG